MTPPVPQPESRTAWTDEPAQPGRVEFTARSHFFIHSISIASHCAANGHEVERITQDGRTIWRAPITAKRDADRYTATLRALDRALKASLKATDHERPQ